MDRALQFLLAALAIGLVAGGAGVSINDVPGFADDTGPTEMGVDSLERLESGCHDDVSGYARSSLGNYSVSKVSVIEADRPDAPLSAWVERTSPAGADLSTFRIHVETTSDGPANASCQHGIRYGLELSYGGGSDGGLIPDDDGMRILHYENGRYAGCSSSTTGGLDDECHRFREPPERTWANATATVDGTA